MNDHIDGLHLFWDTMYFGDFITANESFVISNDKIRLYIVFFFFQISNFFIA